MATFEIHRLCPNCNGVGTVSTSTGPDSQTITCPWPDCDGDGFILQGNFTLPFDLQDILNDILDKVNDIKEVVDEIKSASG